MKKLTALALILSLSACGLTAQQVNGIAAPVAKAVAGAVPVAGPILTATAAIACATQAAANAQGVIAKAQGDAKGANDASKLSTAAGYLCTW